MKKLVSFTFILVILVAFSCKNEPKEVKPELKSYRFSFDLVIPKDDSLQFFYIDDSIPNFKEQVSIWKSVKGDSLPQLISFETPAGYMPTYVRLDFNSQEQSDIKWNSFKAEYDSKYYYNKDSIFTYLFFTNNMELIDSTKNMKILKGENTFDPFIYSNDLLKGKLINLAK